MARLHFFMMHDFLCLQVREGRALALEYRRRSDEMPRPPSTIKHHPVSLHVELLASLLRRDLLTCDLLTS